MGYFTMNNEALGYIKSLINDMSGDKNIVRIIRKNYSICISEEEFNNLQIDDTDKFFFTYSSKMMVEAYAPFLNVIRQIVIERNLDVEEVLIEAGVYSLNISTFISYIETGTAVNNELPIPSEIEYNIMRMKEDIVSLLTYLANQKKIVIFIAEANQMCDSSLLVFDRLMDSENTNLNILAFTNEIGNVKEYLKNEYSEFLAKSDRKGIIFDWPLEVFDEEKKKDLNFVVSGGYDELNGINNMFYTYAWKQAMYYLYMIYQKVEADNIKVSDRYRYDMLLLFMRVSVYIGECSLTLNLVEKFSNTVIGSKEEKEYYCTYYKAMAYMYSGNEKDSIEYALQCHEIAKSLEDEVKIFKSEMLLNMSYLRGWCDVWLCDNKVTVSEEFIASAEKYGYINHLAHIYFYCFDNDAKLYDKVDGIEERIPTVTKGIMLANEIGNDACVLEAYRKNVMISSFNGYFEVTKYFYKKIISIANKMGNRMELANMYNGIGYVSTAYDEFLESNRYYNKALRIFFELKSSDYIIETIYNIGMNAIIAGDYLHATEYFSSVLSMLTQLKKDRVRVCNVSKILGLNALAYYKMGKLYSAQLYINKARYFLDSVHAISENNSKLPLWDDDLFLFYLVSAMLLYEKKEYVEALNNYEKAEYYMKQSMGSRFFNYLQYALEKPKILRAIGRSDEADKLIREAISWYKGINNDMRVRVFEEMLINPDFEMPPVCIELNDITMDEIWEFIETERLMTAAKVRMDRIRIFDSFQRLMNTEFNSIENVINTLISNFKSNFYVDNVLFVSCEDVEPIVKYSDIEYEISMDNLRCIETFFRDNTDGFVLSRYSNNYSDYQFILDIFDRSKIFSIVGVPVFMENQLNCYFITFISIPDSWNSSIRGTLDNEDLEVFSIIFRQIIEATEKFKMNQALVTRAITDELTGLYNRKGFYELVDRMVDRAVKTGKKLDCSILYMDLDHFKFYNDTFGHSVGDVIIKAFADIFKQACEGEGDVIRFGGDEFLIIIESARKQKINRIIDRIYAIIAAQDGFEKLVSQYMGKTVTISKEVRASCSIGIASAIDVKDTETINAIQQKADKALYDVKENGRGRAKFY